MRKVEGELGGEGDEIRGAVVVVKEDTEGGERGRGGTEGKRAERYGEGKGNWEKRRELEDGSNLWPENETENRV